MRYAKLAVLVPIFALLATVVPATAAQAKTAATAQITSGLLVMRFVIDQSGAYVTSFSLHGTQQNGCALLSGQH